MGRRRRPPAAGLADPRLPALGFRGYGATAPAGAQVANFDAHRIALGVPSSEDFGVEAKTYPIEANFDLLAGIDFKKGCFVGQETTSRMKRRGAVKSRMAPIGFEAPRRLTARSCWREACARAWRCRASRVAPWRSCGSTGRRPDRERPPVALLADGHFWRRFGRLAGSQAGRPDRPPGPGGA